MKNKILTISVMTVAIAMLSLLLTTNVYAAKLPETEADTSNITTGNVTVKSELTIDSSDGEKTIGEKVFVAKGGKLTITGTGKVTLSGSIFVDEGGELIIDATDVEATNGIASVVGKLTVGSNANITDKGSNWSIYANGGADITLKGNITANNNVMSIVPSSGITPKVTVEGGKLTAADGKSIFEFATESVTAEITIKDGEFNGDVFGVLSGSNISEDSKIEISGGNFSDTTTIKPEYIAENAKLNGDGTVTKDEEQSTTEGVKPEKTDTNTTENKEPEETENDDQDDTPTMGVENVYVIAGVVALVTIAGAIILNKRK